MQGIRMNGPEMRKRLAGCRIGDLDALAHLTGCPVVDLRMWHRWAQMRRTMGRFFYGLGILLALLSLATLPLWEAMLPRVLACVIALAGAIVAGTAGRHADASLVDYLPADACRMTLVPKRSTRPVHPALRLRGSY